MVIIGQKKKIREPKATAISPLLSGRCYLNATPQFFHKNPMHRKIPRCFFAPQGI
jgi:hypothetical protein